VGKARLAWARALLDSTRLRPKLVTGINFGVNICYAIVALVIVLFTFTVYALYLLDRAVVAPHDSAPRVVAKHCWFGFASLYE
jgi:hypothetical protein